MIDDAHSFIKRLLEFSTGTILSFLISIIIVPLTSWFIMPEEFGRVSMYTLFYNLTLLTLLLGLDQSFLREYYSSKDISVLLWNSFSLPFFISLLTSLAIYLSGKYLTNILFGEFSLIVSVLIAAVVPLGIFERFNTLIIRSQERAKLYSLSTVLRQVFRLSFILFFVLVYEKTYKSIILAEVASVMMNNVFLFFYTRTIWVNRAQLKSNMLKRLFSFGLPLLPASLLSWLFNSFDKIAMRKWSDYSQIGLYSAGFKILGVLNIVKSAFSIFWVPTAYRWYESDQDLKKYEKVIRLLSSAIFVGSALLIVFRKIIILLFAPAYKEAYRLIPFLVFIPSMHVISETTVVGINFKKKTYYHLLIIAFTSLLNIVGNIILVPRYGALGASVSTGFSYIVFFWMRTLISRKLWYNFDIIWLVMNNVLLVAYSCCTLLFSFTAIEIFFALLIIILNIKSMKDIFTFFKNFMKAKIQRSS